MQLNEQRAIRRERDSVLSFASSLKMQRERVDTLGSLARQLERAARVQKSLLPDLSAPLGQYSFAALYRPCEALGGDFYDLFRDHDSAALLVCDVMGHGIEAAMTTMLVKAVFQEAAATTIVPRDLLARMNAGLLPLVPRRVFVAAGVATLEGEGSAVRYAHAGLPHPFVLRSRTQRVEEVEVTGCPIGLFEGEGAATYEATTLTLEWGDVFLIASDGLGSIVNDLDESFEDGFLQEGLARVAGQAGEAVIEHLMASAIQFSGGKPSPDDINLIAITRGSRPVSGFPRHSMADLQNR